MPLFLLCGETPLGRPIFPGTSIENEISIFLCLESLLFLPVYLSNIYVSIIYLYILVDLEKKLPEGGGQESKSF